MIYDAEHFFDGYKNNPDYALKTVEAAIEAGAYVVTLYDTNGGCLPFEVSEITRPSYRTAAATSGFTHITIQVVEQPMPWQRYARSHACAGNL